MLAGVLHSVRVDSSGHWSRSLQSNRLDRNRSFTFNRQLYRHLPVIDPRRRTLAGVFSTGSRLSIVQTRTTTIVHCGCRMCLNGRSTRFPRLIGKSCRYLTIDTLNDFIFTISNCMQIGQMARHTDRRLRHLNRSNPFYLSSCSIWRLRYINLHLNKSIHSN